MNLLCESGLEMQNFMQSQEWEFCFIVFYLRIEKNGRIHSENTIILSENGI
jgi:hypothetical protein